jgi:shikimate kinase
MGGRGAETVSAVRAVALVGFMAAGKSAVGRLAAARLAVPFVDTDELIEERAGSIPAIFAALGEVGFRRIERDVVVKVLDEACRAPRIVALGGGAVLTGDVREALRRLSCIVWLTAPPAVLWSRATGSSTSRRPLARDEKAFARLLAGRSALYAEVASVEMANDGSRPLEAVVDAVVGLARGETQRSETHSSGEGAQA